MKPILYSLLAITAILSFSCKKESTPVPQQTMTLIDFETRLGISNATVKCMKDELVNVIIGTAISTEMKQKVSSDNAGVATFDFIDGGYVFIEANNYLTRRLPMQYAKGAQEMLKSAAVELELDDEHVNSGTITQISISLKTDQQLSALRTSLNLLDTTVQFAGSSTVLQFDGIANRENSIVFTLFGDSIGDTTILITPVPGTINKVVFKY